MAFLLGLLWRLVLAAFSLVLSAALLEAGGRLFYCAAAEHRLSLVPREPASPFVRDRDLLYRQRPGFDGTWGRAHPVRVRVNALGLRGPERAYAPAPGSVRLLALGDSQTWGFDVEEHQAWPAALESLLDRRVGNDRDFEVVNAAVPGYSSFQGLRWAGAHLSRYRPELVLVAYNFNNRLLAGEPTSDFSLRRHTPGSFRAAWRAQWLERSFVVRKLRAAVARWRDHARARERFTRRKRELLERWDDLEAVVKPVEHRTNLRGLVRVSRDAGARVILVGMPEHPALSAALDSALDRVERGERAGAVSGVEDYFALRDSTLLWTWSDYDVLANALARRAGRPGAPEWPHRRAPANVALATARSYDRVAAEVAAERGVRFVDGVEVLGGRPELFMDECHFDARGHALVAELLLPAVVAALGGRADGLAGQDGAPTSRRRASAATTSSTWR